MPRRQIAAYHGLVVLLALVICLHPAIPQDSPGCQAQLELIPPPKQHPPKSPVDLQVEVPSSTPGVDFRPYLRRMTVSISRSLLSRLPESVANGEEGTVVVRVQMRKDGSLSKDGLNIACSSGIKDMDAAAQSAIQSAAPFERLPETYGGPDLVLLFRISYRYIPTNSSRRT
jgi:TonB family protein